MRVLRSILCTFQNLIHPKPTEVAPIECKRAMSGSFFVETIHTDGRPYLIKVDAKTLIKKEGKRHLRGWCNVCPFFHTIPVDRIALLWDGSSGELVPKEDIEDWLLKQALNRIA